jgi:hypothetical protein
MTIRKKLHSDKLRRAAFQKVGGTSRQKSAKRMCQAHYSSECKCKIIKSNLTFLKSDFAKRVPQNLIMGVI